MRSLLARVDPRGASTAALLLAPPVFLLLIVGLTPEPVRLILGADLRVYHDYGSQLLGGAIAYRDFHVEYPPLALVPMVLALAGAPPGGIDDVAYAWRFAFVQGVLAAVGGWLLFEATGRARSTLPLWATLVGLSWVSVALRYDLWAVLCVLAALLLVDRRPGAAGVALGLGTMLKAYPLVLLPILFVAVLARRERAGLVRLVLGCAVTVALVMGGAWLAAGPDSLQWLVYQQERGLQIESLGAGLLLGLHLLVGHPLEVVYAFGSIQVEAPGADLLVAGSPVLSTVLLGLVTVLAALRFRADQARLGRLPRTVVALASAAAITALLVGSKVLSVQYVIWLLPLVPLLPTRMRWLALAITGLTTAIFTTDYTAVWQLEAPALLALLARNVLLLAFAAWLVVELARGRVRQDAVAPA